MRSPKSGPTPIALVLTFAALAAGCAPLPSRDTRAEAPSAPASPKILRVVTQREPANLLFPGTQGQMLPLRIADAELTAIDDSGQNVPVLAREVPSVDAGTWVLNADGTMDVTWKLRSNVKWHDEYPLTSDDLVFGWEYLNHPESVLNKLKWLASVESVSAPDPLTFVVHLSRVHPEANSGSGGGTGGGGSPFLRPLPRHLLGSLFAQGAIETLHAHVQWRDQFIGLGPYRLASWEPGNQLDFTRFDDYFLGRPPLDRIVLRFAPDANVAFARVLSGEIDVCQGCEFGIQLGRDMERQWTGGKPLIGPNGRIQLLAGQFRPEVDVKPAALREAGVRQSLYRAVDRQALADAITLGLSPVADSWIPVDDPRRQSSPIRESIIQYPFDPARARAELGALGWTAGADGMVANSSGEKFAFEVRMTPSAGSEAQLAVVGDSFKAVGASVIQTVIPNQLTSDREYRSLYTGFELTPLNFRDIEVRKFAQREIGTPANRYTGTNKGAYLNPEADRLIQRLQITLVAEERTQISAQILRIGLTDLPVMPLFWDIDLSAVANNIKNVRKPGPYGADDMNVFEWDLVQGER